MKKAGLAAIAVMTAFFSLCACSGFILAGDSPQKDAAEQAVSQIVESFPDLSDTLVQLLRTELHKVFQDQRDLTRKGGNRPADMKASPASAIQNEISVNVDGTSCQGTPGPQAEVTKRPISLSNGPDYT
jgi:hypothetical protein